MVITADQITQEQGDALVCTIDPDTRTIAVPEQCRFLGACYDKCVERLKFRCPKIVGDNKDLSQGFVLFINYINAFGGPDAHKIDDMQVDGEYITFSWMLEENVTAYSGKVKFAFCGIVPGDNQGDPDKSRWGTTINEDCSVLDGLKCTQQVAESNPDALVQIWEAIDELKAGGEGIPGKDGREIEIQNSGTAIQWRYAGDDEWTDLVQLSDLKGDKGNKGDKGDPGARGPAGDSGIVSRQEMQNTDTTITLQPNILYVFPEMASLTVTPGTPSDANVANEYHFFFVSGATATTLTLNDVLSDAYSIEANTKYEVSILEGMAIIKGVSTNAET